MSDQRRVLLGFMGDATAFDPVQGLFSLAGTAITTAGQVGSTILTIDAQKDINKQNLAAQLQGQINQANANLAAQQTTGSQIQGVTETLTSWPVLLFGLAAIYLATRGRS